MQTKKCTRKSKSVKHLAVRHVPEWPKTVMQPLRRIIGLNYTATMGCISWHMMSWCSVRCSHDCASCPCSDSICVITPLQAMPLWFQIKCLSLCYCLPSSVCVLWSSLIELEGLFLQIIQQWNCSITHCQGRHKDILLPTVLHIQVCLDTVKGGIIFLEACPKLFQKCG